MLIFNKVQTLDKEEEILLAIKNGAVFIYPTDTIYGIGCSAIDEEAVQKIRKIKKRDRKPLSIIAPSKDWIQNNCILQESSRLDLLPGPYTLILKMKDPKSIAENVSFNDTLGVRIPRNWFADIVRKADVPFITTSVNLSGDNHMRKLEDVSEYILNKIDYIIYEGPITGVQSEKIDLTSQVILI